MVRVKLSGLDFKKKTIQVWDEVAPRYHKRWAKKNEGPFCSTNELVRLAGIKKNDLVLDIACGTGAVVTKLLKKLRNNGFVLGLDISKKAISIAKEENQNKENLGFIIADAETIHFVDNFDVITCQYALFFFPNSRKALFNIKRNLKPDGTLAISVHGNNVPFFNCIIDAVTKFIPDYIPPGSPKLDRFGSKKTLREEISKIGFKKIKVNEFNFRYSPGTFADYWNNYLKYIPKSLREKVDSLSSLKKTQLKELVKNNTKPYTKNGKIVFPWQVLILIAKK